MTGADAPIRPATPVVTAVAGAAFDYGSLGWKAFQELCLTILTEVLGQSVETYLSSNDGGRDGAFTGHWRSTETDSGGDLAFTFQCKFTGKRMRSLRLSDLEDEFIKVARLVKRGLCDVYVLMTNAPLSARTAATIRDRVLGLGARRVHSYGSTRLDQFIRESTRLRTLVPRLYGLGDLSQILDERSYAQARAVLESMRDELDKFVMTRAYRQAVDILQRYGFVLLLGDPAAGKSMIAATLAVSATDLWQLRATRADTPTLFRDHWNPEDPAQFFWVDDAFGTTQYQSTLADQWNRVMPELNAAIRAGTRFAMTSRNYIWRSAERDLKLHAFPPLQFHQVVVDVQDITEDERKDILYNHLKLGRQPTAFRRSVKPHLDRVSENPRFLPESARRFGDPLFTADLHVSRESVDRFFDEPRDLLREVLLGLGAQQRAAVALIFMSGGSRSIPLTIDSSERDLLRVLGGTPDGVRDALQQLDGSIVARVRSSISIDDRHDDVLSMWTFKHPTIGDAYGLIVGGDPELLDVYLRGARLDTVLSEVVCGAVDVPGNAVVVPQSRFPSMVGKLRPLVAAKRMTGDRAKLISFLTRRTSPGFLAEFLEAFPDIFSWIVGPYYPIEDCDEVKLAVALQRARLLPDDLRRACVEELVSLAIDWPDSGILHDDVQELFTAEEYDAAVERVREDLMADLDRVIGDWASSFSSGSDIDSYFDPLTTSIEEFGAVFVDDQQIQSDVASALQRIYESIDELRSDSDEPEDYSDYRWAAGGPSALRDGERSVFEDVDE